MDVYVLQYTNVETGEVEILGVYSSDTNANLAANAHMRNLINECDFCAIVDIVDEYANTSAGTIDLESDDEVSAAFFDLSYQIIRKTVDKGV